VVGHKGVAVHIYVPEKELGTPHQSPLIYHSGVWQTNTPDRDPRSLFWTRRFLRTASAHHLNLNPAGPAHREILLRSKWGVLGFHNENFLVHAFQ
jgi:hypothetical protein